MSDESKYRLEVIPVGGCSYMLIANAVIVANNYGSLFVYNTGYDQQKHADRLP